MRVNFLGLKCFLSLFVGFLLTPLTTTYAQMTVNDQLTAQQLVEALIGSGITPSNVSFQGTTQMAGSFQKNNSTFNFERGILLTSGSSAGAVGANNSTSAGVNRSLSGHQLITNLVAPYTSYDACALQFDFYPSTNTVSFNYIFGSEEYDEFVCTQFIDAFGFFVTGANPAGGQYTDANMALVPGTSTYVGVNTVNNGKPGDASCIPQNTTHYRSNTSGTEFQYDAFTRVMPVSFNVVPGQLYTIKLIIADAGNGTYDSGVFIEGGSFTSCPAPTVTNGTRCGAGAVALSASGTTNGNYRWYTAATGGTAITGEVNSTYNANVTQTTTYYVSIVNNSGTASCESNRVAVTATVTTATAPSTTGAAICGTGSVTLAASGGTNGQYRWYTVASGGTAISGATNSTYTTPSITQTTNYYVSIASSATCESARTSVVARVNPLPNNLTPPISLVTQNFKTFAAATENLQYSVNNVPPLVSGVTDTKHSIIIQTAPQMADATTGLPAPDWTKKTETVLDFPSTTPLTVGTRTVLLSSLVTQTEQPKNIFWRVGLRYKLAEGTNQPVSWSDLYSFQLTGTAAVIPSTNLQAGDTSSTQHTNKINWVYEVTYLDDNKTSQHISYADGLMKTRQQQVLVSSNTTYKVLCNETVYSEEGGGVVNTMGAPKTTAPLDKFSYDYRFFDVKSGSTYSDFTTRHFDAEQTVAGVRDIIPATPIDTTAGVGSYYRNASTMESHVDDAKGYPYSYSVGYKDPLNRLMVSAGTGETFRMGGGKETKFSSGSVGYNELKRVYGREGALKLKNITKSLTTDPNGVGVVSYTDDEGKTIATALTTCNAPVGTQDALVEDGMANFVAEYNILANNVLNDEALSKASSSSFILTCAQADVNVHYEIDQATFLSGLTATTCKSCEYDLKIKIVENANGRVVKDTVRAMPMTALTCGQTNKYVLDFVVKPGKAGSYTVYRTLKPRVNAVTGRTVVEEAIANYTESFKTDTLTKRNAFAAKYYGKDEWYAMRKMKLAGNRPQQVKNCLSSFVSSSAIPYRPWAIDVSKTSNSIFINDYFFIRKITSAGVVSNVFSQSGIKDATVDDEDNVFFVINNSVYKIAKGATTESLIYNATSVKGIKYFNNSLYLRIPATGNTSKTTFIKVSVTGTVLKNDFLPSGSELPFASTELDSWTAVSIDNKGNEEIYVSSKTQNLIYKIANGGYSIFAGTGTAGSVNGHRTTAQLRAPAGLAFDKAGNLFVSEHTTIRKIDMSTGIVTTYAGVNGTSAFVDGPLEGTTSLKGPQGIAFDAANNLFIADDTRISKIGACGIASNCNEVLPSKAQVTFSNSGVKTLVLQPNAREGKDADVRTSVSKPNNQITNYSNIDFTLFTEGTGKSRSLIQFDLSQIPTNAQIINSTLSFYESKSDVFDTCALFLRKITAAWQENSVTWSNQPAFTTTNQVSVPAANGDVSLDLTKIVQESVTTPAQNFGYMLMLQNEAFSGSTKAKYYGSSDNRNAKSRPRLEITYIVPQSTCANLSTLTDYATVTLNLTPPTDKTGTPVAIGQAKWSKGMTNESFTTALATSVNGNYNSNNLGFKTSNNLGLGYSNQVNNTLSFNAAVGSGSRYNGWTIKPTISYTTGIDPACFAISPTNIIPFTGGYSQGQCDEYVWVAD
ncbi:MAG TPA: choice-of-anchor L domain-containing protein, partial [Cytophagaceae bacterium]